MIEVTKNTEGETIERYVDEGIPTPLEIAEHVYNTYFQSTKIYISSSTCDSLDDLYIIKSLLENKIENLISKLEANGE